jgi:hypothetical protein
MNAATDDCKKPVNIILLLLLLGLFVWFWQSSLRAWESAREASGLACQRCGVQLLDDTVALQRLWLRRDRDGRLRTERIYHFEFTDTGTTRRLGRLIMVGQQVEELHMEGDDLIIP